MAIHEAAGQVSEEPGPSVDDNVDEGRSRSLTLPPPARQPTRLLLIRHAESMRRGLFPVDDPGLSARGWEQATALGAWLHSHEEIHGLFTGAQLRCRLTAQRIGQQIGVAPAVLRPRAAQEDGKGHLVDLVRQLLAAQAGQTIAIILDAADVQTLLQAVGLGPQLQIVVGPSSITELCADEDGWRLCCLNRRDHLPPMEEEARPRPARTQEEVDAAQEAERIRHVYNQAAAVYSHEPDKPEAGPRLSGSDLWRFAQLEPEARILEVGAGRGRMAVELAQAGAGEVVGVDVSPAMLEQAELRRLSLKDPALAQRISFRLAFGRDLPFVEHRFDVVLLCQIVHHLAQPLPTLEECRRVLRPEGQLVIVDLAGPEDAVKRATYNAIEAKRNPSHAAVRTVQQMQSLLEQARFTVEKHEVRTAPCSAHLWLRQLGVDDAVRTQVLEMLEASMETDAAGLHVRRQGDDLIFDEPIALILARRTTTP